MDSLSISCPHCGESFPLALDPSEGTAQFTVDCEICCRPMSLQVSFDDNGELAGCDVTPE